MNVITSREFYQNTGKAYKLAKIDPVLITKYGKPDIVVLNYSEYQRLNNLSPTRSLYDVFATADPQVAEIELELPERTVDDQRPEVEF
ncbi:type II toxin-antitoxin system prevent-host-death family antitoxin [Lonepinella sp. MS14436]|uniref:type II toxin-antitoxin system prevent-host-death family antitoxin n=1 Tax=Lonepinella sp. MS14436 TaxID=3003619 RepID=UPI0036DB8CF4